MTGLRARLLVAAAALVAFAPSLGGGFLDLDDTRFVRDNEALRRFTPLRYLTDPSTISDVGWQGTYRPLRTLDLAIDRAIGGGPLVFHLRNLIYHALGALLVLALLVRLLGEGPAALAGALLFAVHPVQAESVAWITSRADVLLVALFVGGVLLHVAGWRLAALLLLVLALLAKESAVVFPAAVLVVDVARNARPRWRWLGAYGGAVAGYAALRTSVLGGAGHLGGAWWGGSYWANLLTAARGLALDAQGLLLPVSPAVDFHVPGTTGLDTGALLGLAVLLGLAAIAWRGGRVGRTALAWAALTWLPTSNLLFTVGIPTSDRFLALPMVGIAFGAGVLLARSRWRWAVLACFLALSVSRSRDWRSDAALFAANGDLATPRTLAHRAGRALDRAWKADGGGDRAAAEREAEAVLRDVDAYRRFFPERMGIPEDEFGGGRLEVKRANALLLLGRTEEAWIAAREAARLGAGAPAHYNAFVALLRLGRAEPAHEELERTLRDLEARPVSVLRDLRVALSADLNAWARDAAARGRGPEALELHRMSWRALPDPAANREAARALGLERGGR